jgi:proteasome beta subunit
MLRRIFPVVGVVTSDGYQRLPEDEVAAIVDAAWAERHRRPDGPASATLT